MHVVNVVAIRLMDEGMDDRTKRTTILPSDLLCLIVVISFHETGDYKFNLLSIHYRCNSRDHTGSPHNGTRATLHERNEVERV